MRAQFVKPFFDLDTLHARKPPQRHIDNRLRLHVGEFKLFHQLISCFRYRLAGTDDAYNAVDIVNSELEPLVNMFIMQRVFKIEFGAPGDNFFLVFYIMI